jgi:thiamine-phosphate pyrophosphorylase
VSLPPEADPPSAEKIHPYKIAMNKKKLLEKIQLYVIVDKKLCYPRKIEEVVLDAVEGGAQMIQFRDKESSDRSFLEDTKRIKKITDKRKIPFIINDRLDVALYLNCDGVHLGQKDLPYDFAREILGNKKIVGISAETLGQAKKAQRVGADYIGLGPVFHTTSKEIEKVIEVEVVRRACQQIDIPIFAIGGINKDNVSELVKVGCRRIAVISSVVCAPDSKKAAKEFLKELKKLFSNR